MSLNHFGLTVGDLEQAIRFYAEIGSLRLIGGPERIDTSDPVSTARRKEIFGEAWLGSRIAHLVDHSGVGLELFEFDAPAPIPPTDHLEFWRVGIFHFAVTVKDMDLARQRLRELGGETRTPVYPLKHGRRICYCRDPWGNALELSSHDYTSLVAVASPTALEEP